MITESLIADEFSRELSEGLAYVAGHDDDARPVVVHFFDSHFFLFTVQTAICLFVCFYFFTKY